MTNAKKIEEHKTIIQLLEQEDKDNFNNFIKNTLKDYELSHYDGTMDKYCVSVKSKSKWKDYVFCYPNKAIVVDFYDGDYSSLECNLTELAQINDIVQKLGWLEDVN